MFKLDLYFNNQTTCQQLHFSFNKTNNWSLQQNGFFFKQCFIWIRLNHSPTSQYCFACLDFQYDCPLILPFFLECLNHSCSDSKICAFLYSTLVETIRRCCYEIWRSHPGLAAEFQWSQLIKLWLFSKCWYQNLLIYFQIIYTLC